VQTPIKQQHSTEDHDGVDEHPAPAQHLEPIQSVVSASGGPIDETIRIRDLHQFEIKLHYPLSRKRAVETYDLELLHLRSAQPWGASCELFEGQILRRPANAYPVQDSLDLADGNRRRTGQPAAQAGSQRRPVTGRRP